MVSEASYTILDAEEYLNRLGPTVPVPEVVNVYDVNSETTKIEEINFEESTGLFRKVDTETIKSAIEESILEKHGDLQETAMY